MQCALLRVPPRGIFSSSSLVCILRPAPMLVVDATVVDEASRHSKAGGTVWPNLLLPTLSALTWLSRAGAYGSRMLQH